MKDFIVNSCLAGTVSFIYKNVFNQLIYSLDITPFLYRVTAASLVLTSNMAHTILGVIIGLFTDLILVIWVALTVAYVLKVTGRDYYLIKGAFVGGSFWLLIYGFFIHSGVFDLYEPHGLTSGFTTIFFDITVGIVSSAILVYLDRKENEKRPL